jgi:hypothetical protein
LWEELQSGTIAALEKHNGEYSENAGLESTGVPDKEELAVDCKISSNAVKCAAARSTGKPLTSENKGAESMFVWSREQKWTGVPNYLITIQGEGIAGLKTYSPFTAQPASDWHQAVCLHFLAARTYHSSL